MICVCNSGSRVSKVGEAMLLFGLRLSTGEVEEEKRVPRDMTPRAGLLA